MGEGATRTRILAVDDEEKLLQQYEELLTPRGYSVTTCSSSHQALSLLKTAEYDVVLLDIRMPGLEGTDLVPLVKRLRPELPVIIVSAYCEEMTDGGYHQLGAFEAINKPFSHEALLASIARATHREERIHLILRNLSLREARDQVYRKVILSALQKTNWNQVRAAELLGVSRYCLMRWMKKLGISY